MTLKKWGALGVVLCIILSLSVYAVDDPAPETTPPAPTQIYVEQVSFSTSEILLKPNGTSILKYTLTPSNATVKTVAFQSEDESIVAVDNKGKLTAKAVGSATITITSDSNPSATDICVVTVEPVQLTRLNLSVKKLSMGLGAIQRLPVTAAPSNASLGSLQYRSTDSAVCSVDAAGNLSANYPGTAVITVSSGSLSAECTVTVKPTPSLQLGLGKANTLRMTGAKKNLGWQSSDESVASVVNGKVTAVGYGSAVITATNPVDNSTQTWTVGVVNYVKKITVPERSLTLYCNTKGEGQSYTVIPSVVPADATSLGFSFTSSDGNVAEVSDSGVITAIAPGRARITVASLNAGRKTAVTVMVYPEPSIFEMSDGEAVISLGRRKALKLDIGSGSSRKGIVWTTSNSAIADVNRSGSVSGLNVGNATITASIPGMRSVTAKVEVSVPLRTIKLDKRSLVMERGASISLSYQLVPENTSDNKLTWTSSNTEIATVDQNGKINAIGFGSARILVESENGRRASCTVRVPRLTR